MPSVYDLKPRFQGLLRPGVGALARAGVTANQVTAAAAVLSLAVGATIALLPERRWPLLLLPLALLVRMALNAVDGMLAREHGQRSRLGALLNELGDVVADAALYLPLAVVPGVPAAPVIAIVLLAAISELAGVLGVTIGASRRYDGPGGKSDRALVLGALGLALGACARPGRWLTVLLWLVAAAVALTIVNRSRAALREAAGAAPRENA